LQVRLWSRLTLKIIQTLKMF